MYSRRKFLLLILVIILGGSGIAVSACAAPVPAASSPATTTADRVNPKEVEKSFEAGEAALRKIKQEHVRQERQQRLTQTQQAYAQAVMWYRQWRFSLAQEKLSYVQNLMRDYKATPSLVKAIHARNQQKSDRHNYRALLIHNPDLIKDLALKAAALEEEIEILGDDKTTIPVRKQLAKIEKQMQQLKRQEKRVTYKQYKQWFLQQQLDRINARASAFDQEIVRLTQAGNYAAAKRKYDEFRHTMADELGELKRTMQVWSIENEPAANRTRIGTQF